MRFNKAAMRLLAAAACLELARAMLDKAESVKMDEGEAAGPPPPPPPPPRHFWPHARGHVGAYGTTSLRGPANLTANFSWSFSNPNGRYHHTMTGGAVLDSQKNIYVSTEFSIWKLSPKGKVLWQYNNTHKMSAAPSLMDNAVYGADFKGHVFALDLQNGTVIWDKAHGNSTSGDTFYVEAHAGVVVTGVNAYAGIGGNANVIGANATTGDLLWRYTALHAPVWNVMPMFPDDDTTVFMDLTGGVYRLGLTNGTLIWYAPPPGSSRSFSDGGLILGPNGTGVYTCSNPGNGSGYEGQTGALRKFDLASGKLEWDVQLPYPCNSWPAVSADGKSVVVVPGSFNDNAPTLNTISNGAINMQHQITPMFLQEFHQQMLAWGDQQRKKFGQPELRAAIMSYDTATGLEQWRHVVKPWGAMASAGDEEGILDRLMLAIRPECLPAHWSAPTIDADGTVYVGRTNGHIYRYSPHVGESSYVTGTGPLHSGTTFAPGMMAYTDCDSLYVFNF